MVKRNSHTHTTFIHPLTHSSTHVQAFEFYDEVLRSLDLVLALADESTLAAAQKIADSTSLPPFLFKQFNDQFYRPATP